MNLKQSLTDTLLIDFYQTVIFLPTVVVPNVYGKGLLQVNTVSTHYSMKFSKFNR